MLRSIFFAVSMLALGLALPGRAVAQEWSPPSRTMPAMPSPSDLAPNWMSGTGWFSGISDLAGVSGDLRVAGEPSGGRGASQLVRVTSGPVPVVVWQDRNGDGRADLIEIFRNGSVLIQVIDADYDGQANVLRRYDQSGTLLREERL